MGTNESIWLDPGVDVEELRWSDWSVRRAVAGFEDISYRGVPVLRALRIVVRDQDWRTAPTRVESIDSHVDDTGMRVTVTARCTSASVDFSWESVLSIDAAGLAYAFTGRAERDFLRNRIGIIVLHYPDDAGSALTVTDPDGGDEVTAFPLEIAPHQPAKNIAALGWTRAGIAVTARFSGDVFEMEDQRNWSDASFKTYSTPLEREFPVALSAGETVTQSLSLSCDGDPSAESHAPAESAAARVRRAAAPQRFPAIALAASTAPGAARGHLVSAPLLVELDVRDANWRAALERATEDAADQPLDVRIIARDGADVDHVVAALDGRRVIRLAAFDAETHVTEQPLTAALTRAAGARSLDAEILVGTRAHFTELNRTIDRLPSTGPLTFSVTPQMHDTELRQLIESLRMQRLIAEQAVRMAGGRAVHIGPVTPRARFNAVATTPYAADEASDVAAGYGAERVPDSTDPRQRSEAMAAWLTASGLALAVPGVASITLCEQWGPRGLADDAGDYPVAAAAERLIALAGEPFAPLTGLPAHCYGAEFPNRCEFLLVNLRDDAVTVDVAEAGAITLPPGHVRRLGG